MAAALGTSVAHIPDRGGLKPATKHSPPLCFLSWSPRKAALPLPLPLPLPPIKTGLKPKSKARAVLVIMASSAIETEKLGIKIVKNPPESLLSELGVRSWSKWGCPPSNFPWTYSAKETCYLLKGKVKVYPEGSKEAVEIGAGDLVVFPKGMSCTWDVSEAVDKHYLFE